MLTKKHIIAIDFILIVGSFFVIAGFVGFAQPLVIAPLDDYTTTETSVLFSFENAQRILIDESIDFSSPTIFEVNEDVHITLTPGTYYWKLEGITESETRSLTIQSVVDLRLQKNAETYDIVNAGNTKLAVEIYENGSFSETIILDVSETTSQEGNTIIGGKHE